MRPVRHMVAGVIVKKKQQINLPKKIGLAVVPLKNKLIAANQPSAIPNQTTMIAAVNAAESVVAILDVLLLTLQQLQLNR